MCVIFLNICCVVHIPFVCMVFARCSLGGLHWSSYFIVLLSVLFQVYQLQLVSPSPSCFIVLNSLTRSWYLSLFSLSFNFAL